MWKFSTCEYDLLYRNVKDKFQRLEKNFLLFFAISKQRTPEQRKPLYNSVEWNLLANHELSHQMEMVLDPPDCIISDPMLEDAGNNNKSCETTANLVKDGYNVVLKNSTRSWRTKLQAPAKDCGLSPYHTDADE